MVSPGDVVLTRTKGFVPRAIRFFAALLGKPNVRNHVVVVHHYDLAGTLWGIEARPGGVGWVDMTQYMKDNWTLTNHEQPKTDSQRELICQVAESMLQRPYDYTAIAADAVRALRLEVLWHARDFGDDEIPAQVVCSALADWVYEKVGLDNPGKQSGTRFCTPGDWDEFITLEGWTVV